MATHTVTVAVDRSVEQVYPLFTHFNDFPKFMHFIKEVSYYDDQRSHWVADVVGRHEWDAVNDSWIPNQQITWHSTDGLQNSGKVLFQALSPNQTQVEVTIEYTPPAGFVGNIGEALGAGHSFEQALTRDLENFARMVDQAPEGALDPMSSNYLFHQGSAAARGETTPEQNATM